MQLGCGIPRSLGNQFDFFNLITRGIIDMVVVYVCVFGSLYKIFCVNDGVVTRRNI